MKTNFSLAVLSLGAIVLVGCGAGGDTETPPAPVAANPAAPEMTFANLPGLPVAMVADPDKVFHQQAQLVAEVSGRPRPDPFALKPAEKRFDTNQTAARLFGQMGSFTVVYEPPQETAVGTVPQMEPQPYRRLSGIIVGDSVYAILENGTGTPEIIRPGMRIPNTEWTVVSIDQDKAVLRRNGNVLPKTVVVRLESPPAGMAGNSGTNGRPPGMGNPGGPPGGFGRPGGPTGPGRPGGMPGRGGGGGSGVGGGQ